MIENKYDQLTGLIQGSKVKEALEETLINLKTVYHGNDIMLLQARFVKNEEGKNKGTIRKDDYDIEYNKIVSSILEILDKNKDFLLSIKIEQKIHPKQKDKEKKNNVRNKILALSVFGLVLFVIIGWKIYTQPPEGQKIDSNQQAKFQEYKMQADTFFYHNDVDKAEEYYKKADSVIKTPEVDKLLGFCASVKRNGPGTYLNKDSTRACDVLYKKDMIDFYVKPGVISLKNWCEPKSCIILDTSCIKMYRYGDKLESPSFNCNCN